MRGGAVIVLCLTVTAALSEEIINTTATDQGDPSTDADWGIGSIRDSFEAINGYFDSFLELLGGRNGVCQYKCRYGSTVVRGLQTFTNLANTYGRNTLQLARRRERNAIQESSTREQLYFLHECLRKQGRRLFRDLTINLQSPMAVAPLSLDSRYQTLIPADVDTGQSGPRMKAGLIDEKFYLCGMFAVGLDLGIPAMTKCCNQLDLCYDTCGANKYRCDAKFRWCLYGICSDLKKSLGFVSKVEACESVADTMFNAVWTLGCKPFMNSQRSACVCNEEERDEL